MSILERFKKTSERIEHLTLDELRWLEVQGNKSANPSDLLNLGILRQDLDVKCPGGKNVRAVKLYSRGNKHRMSVVQTELPNRFLSISTSSDDVDKLAEESVIYHCQKYCQRENACLKESS